MIWRHNVRSITPAIASGTPATASRTNRRRMELRGHRQHDRDGGFIACRYRRNVLACPFSTWSMTRSRTGSFPSFVP